MSLSNLQPFTAYQFRVFALNGMGTSKPSPLAEFTTSQKAPGTPPWNIQAKGLSDTSFEATWLPPKQPNGQIRGYRLYYVTDPKQNIDKWLYKASAINQTQITGLKKMTTYYFKLIAYNSAGEGPLSGLFAVKTAQGAPGQPGEVKVIVLSPRAIQVTWQAPRYIGEGVLGYEVYYNKSTAGMDTSITVGDNTFGQEIRDLSPYTYYQVQVAAKSYVPIGPMSFVKVVQTMEDIPSAAPQNIRSKGLDSTSLEISWDPPPTGHRNGRITNYTIKYREKGVDVQAS
ncbi:hypothetical protein OS493_019059 [Desmophyllum pertusum]|uniref:Fibronectin type-III domain-containing protein n=1 Tax=Desmophyllum pertusum TaxID=174260 RepID=A0A9W9Z032_9CNID|nr:hypothetical protein OS493_019059 [Desmophyllum pertusum]